MLVSAVLCSEELGHLNEDQLCLRCERGKVTKFLLGRVPLLKALLLSHCFILNITASLGKLILFARESML